MPLRRWTERNDLAMMSACREAGGHLGRPSTHRHRQRDQRGALPAQHDRLLRLRTVAVLRADQFWYGVSNDNPANAGNGSDRIVSPKLSIVMSPADRRRFVSGVAIGINDHHIHPAEPRTFHVGCSGVSEGGSDQSVPQCRAPTININPLPG